MSTKKTPGKAHRKGLTVMELFQMFPDEATATKWFEGVIWGDKRACGHCGSFRTREASHKKMPYWCSDCRSYFSVRTSTPMARSKVPLQKWAIAIYLCLTSLKSISSMKLHRDIGVSQPTAWFMLHRIREAWAGQLGGPFGGPVEVDETFVGGKEANKHKSKRLNIRAGQGGKTVVAGAKDRATGSVSAAVVPDTTASTMVRWCPSSMIAPGRPPGSLRTGQRPTTKSSTRTKPSSTAPASTSGGRFTPTASNLSGRC